MMARRAGGPYGTPMPGLSPVDALNIANQRYVDFINKGGVVLTPAWREELAQLATDRDEKDAAFRKSAGLPRPYFPML